MRLIQSFRYSFHVGRSHFLLGDIERAVPFLRTALSMKESANDTRFYLALALCQSSMTSMEGTPLLNEAIKLQKFTPYMVLKIVLLYVLISCHALSSRSKTRQQTHCCSFKMCLGRRTKIFTGPSFSRQS
jgi:hypothetical protein